MLYDCNSSVLGIIDVFGLISNVLYYIITIGMKPKLWVLTLYISIVHITHFIVIGIFVCRTSTHHFSIICWEYGLIIMGSKSHLFVNYTITHVIQYFF